MQMCKLWVTIFIQIFFPAKLEVMDLLKDGGHIFFSFLSKSYGAQFKQAWGGWGRPERGLRNFTYWLLKTGRLWFGGKGKGGGGGGGGWGQVTLVLAVLWTI